MQKKGMQKILMSVSILGFLFIMSACSLFPGGPGSIVLLLYPEGLSPDAITPDMNLQSIVTIDPPIQGKSVFLEEDGGMIRIYDVPEGTYTIHPLFLPNSHDVSITVSQGETTYEEVLFPYLGLYYYVINVDSAVQELQDQTVREALSLALSRADLVSTFGGDNATALDLIPPQLQNDGMEAVGAVTESFSDAETLLTGSTPFSFSVLYNETSSGSQYAIAAEFKSQVEALSAVDTVTLVGQEWYSYLDTRNAFGFDVARAGWILDSNNILVFLKLLIAQSGYSNPDLDILLARAEDELERGDIAAHAATLVDIHSHLLNAMIVIPMYYI